MNNFYDAIHNIRVDAREISNLANAFHVTGNKTVAKTLFEISTSLNEACRIADESYNAAMNSAVQAAEASSNAILYTALAMAKEKP